MIAEQQETPTRTQSKLPPDLLTAIAAQAGRVVVVLGAGCSHEAPTGLPLTASLATECHRRLIADGILESGDVTDVSDLSAVAEAVFTRTGSQRELVERFPPDAFRNAEPNDGYMIAAAMLLEGALGTAMTLNFDLAQTTALARLGAGATVSTIRGPDDHHHLGAHNLIYLHRDINSDPDDLILRAAALESEWRERWEEVVASRVLASPVTVFVGLGTPAGVLVETVRGILKALQDTSVTVLVVDPVDPDRSRFFAALDLGPEVYIKLGWSEFMVELAERLVQEQQAAMEQECRGLVADLALEAEDISGICGRMCHLGLLELGRLRAGWFLDEGSYRPYRGTPHRLLGDVLLGIAMIERMTGMQARFVADGFVEFVSARGSTRAMMCSGQGWMPKATLEARARFRLQRRGHGDLRPSVIVAAGIAGGGTEVATPPDITGESDAADVVAGAGHVSVVTVTELREQPKLIRDLFG